MTPQAYLLLFFFVLMFTASAGAGIYFFVGDDE